MISKSRVFSLIRRGIYNLIVKKPLCISFEITHSCNAKCMHCHLGGTVDENRASASHLGNICRTLNPVVAQISGGEPLMRNDIIQRSLIHRRIDKTEYLDLMVKYELGGDVPMIILKDNKEYIDVLIKRRKERTDYGFIINMFINACKNEQIFVLQYIFDHYYNDIKQNIYYYYENYWSYPVRRFISDRIEHK